MKYNVFDIATLGIDISTGIPADFELQLIQAGTQGHVPLEKYVVDGCEVMVVYRCDISKLDIDAAAVVFQTDDDALWQEWLSNNTIQPEAGVI